MFTIQEILKATGGNLLNGKLEAIICDISIDSRTIQPGELFIAIRGQRYDGHDFISEAVEKGAKAVIVSDSAHWTKGQNWNAEGWKNRKIIFIGVPDTIKALGDIAHYHRKRFGIPIIAVTGSNGKTTTKEMIACILNRKFKVLKNEGTQNNYIGLPLNLLRLRPEHTIAVLEMGTSMFGQIRRLKSIAQPNVGVITNVGPSHLEFLGNLEGVFKAKCELIEDFHSEDLAILNGDDEWLSKIDLKSAPFRRATFGIENKCDYHASKIGYRKGRLNFTLNQNCQIGLKILGRHNVYNALSAISVCKEFGIDLQSIKDELASFQLPPMRMRIRQAKGIKIIDDSYNSNPQSMRAALGTLLEYKAPGRKILVSGDMLELGKQAIDYHYFLGRLIASSKLDFVVTFGELSKRLKQGLIEGGFRKESIWDCQSIAEAIKLLTELARPGDVVLIKGSRAMMMEEVVNGLISSIA